MTNNYDAELQKKQCCLFFYLAKNLMVFEFFAHHYHDNGLSPGGNELYDIEKDFHIFSSDLLSFLDVYYYHSLLLLLLISPNGMTQEKNVGLTKLSQHLHRILIDIITNNQFPEYLIECVYQDLLSYWFQLPLLIVVKTIDNILNMFLHKKNTSQCSRIYGKYLEHMTNLIYFSLINTMFKCQHLDQASTDQNLINHHRKLVNLLTERSQLVKNFLKPAVKQTILDFYEFLRKEKTC